MFGSGSVCSFKRPTKPHTVVPNPPLATTASVSGRLPAATKSTTFKQHKLTGSARSDVVSLPDGKHTAPYRRLIMIRIIIIHARSVFANACSTHGRGER